MRYRIFVLIMALEALVLGFLVTAGYFSAVDTQTVHRCNRRLVEVLELTDLAIWTGARYTRHVSQADAFSAFQDSMGALEHFPEGALAPLPAFCRPTAPAATAKSIPAAAAVKMEADHEPSS
jgi:hypothetical protein